MKESRRMAALRVGLLVALSVCLLACALAWVYQAACSFEVATPEVRVRAGQEARFRLRQSDCLMGAFASACYEPPAVDVRGLPDGAAVKVVEFVDCHQSDLVVTTETTAAPGSYRLTIGREGAFFPGERAVLEIAAP
ncbi:MAG: hypothetical protein PHY79_04215 [Anaerolineae bacterium]|nr:hypothetical protein [Anaerolineae bacterium]MDX9831820.1 hypothetical protein [Anaerolineae bacterium]